MRRPAHYHVKKVYIVTCAHPDCNQSIGRPVSGEDPETQADVDQVIAEHEQAYHQEED